MAITRRSLKIGTATLDFPSPSLTEMVDSSGLPVDVLRSRLAGDGYLLIRGLYQREQVLSVRHDMLGIMRSMGMLDPASPLEVGMARTGEKGGYYGDPTHALNVLPSFRALVESREVVGFFDSLFGEPSRTFDYKWLRAVGQGEFSGAHLDRIYMGRGTDTLYTIWTPIGDTPADMGTLALVPESHRLPGYARLRSTYGAIDVDRDHIDGTLEDDPTAATRAWGGAWATADFRAGDALIFGMHMLHMSTTNTTPRLRISSDTRFQPASHVVDDRWIGPSPRGNDQQRILGTTIMVAQARTGWGI